MAVAVLNPRDCLQNPLSSRQGLLSPPPRVRSSRNPNPNPSRSYRAQPSRRKRSPNCSSPRAAVPLPPHTAAKDLVMGQVKILKRGEIISKTSPGNQDPVPDLGSTHRLGPDPQLVPTQIRLAEPNKAAHGFYAGSAFVTSPPPSSLPLPAFFMKKSAGIDDATSGLRRILGLSL